MRLRKPFLLPVLLSAIPAVATAQTAAPPPSSSPIEVDVVGGTTADVVIAVPVLPTPKVAATEAGSTEALGRQVAEVIASDLRGSGLFKPLGPSGIGAVSFPEVTAPAFDRWGSAAALVQGFVRANGDGQLTVGCYLYDVALKSELTRKGFVIAARDWRRAAHKCADAIYARLSGEKLPPTLIPGELVRRRALPPLAGMA